MPPADNSVGGDLEACQTNGPVLGPEKPINLDNIGRIGYLDQPVVMKPAKGDHTHHQRGKVGNIQPDCYIVIYTLGYVSSPAFKVHRYAALLVGQETVDQRNLHLKRLPAKVMGMKTPEKGGSVDDSVHQTHTLSVGFVIDRRNEVTGIIARIVN